MEKRKDTMDEFHKELEALRVKYLAKLQKFLKGKKMINFPGNISILLENEDGVEVATINRVGINGVGNPTMVTLFPLEDVTPNGLYEIFAELETMGHKI